MEPYIGQIKQMAFNWAPRDFALCNGETITFQENAALGSLLGSQFGGNGTTNFQLPNLQGRVPMHPTAAMQQGLQWGYEYIALTADTMPRHTHTFKADEADGDYMAAENFSDPDQHKVLAKAVLYGTTTPANIYGVNRNLVQLNVDTSSFVGGGLTHNNMQPSLVINFVIALQGVYPSRN